MHVCVLNSFGACWGPGGQVSAELNLNCENRYSNYKMLTLIINIIANTQNCHNALFSLLVCVLQVFVQFLSVFQWCSKCEGEWWACLVSWVHLQEGPLVIVEGLHHFSEADTRVVVRVPAKGEEGCVRKGGKKTICHTGSQMKTEIHTLASMHDLLLVWARGIMIIVQGKNWHARPWYTYTRLLGSYDIAMLTSTGPWWHTPPWGTRVGEGGSSHHYRWRHLQPEKQCNANMTCFLHASIHSTEAKM